VTKKHKRQNKDRRLSFRVTAEDVELIQKVQRQLTRDLGESVSEAMAARAAMRAGADEILGKAP
jgi:hypothetical protein